jgi:hypothetical protein
MDHAEKGRRYAQLFRKAGVFLAQADLTRAAQALSEGEALAHRLGDHTMARRFAEEIARIQNSRSESE